MPDEALQAAFEIKAACDDISRKLLRWHWEQKPLAKILRQIFDGVEDVDAAIRIYPTIFL